MKRLLLKQPEVLQLLDGGRCEVVRVVKPQPTYGCDMVNAAYCGHPEKWLASGPVGNYMDKTGKCAPSWQSPFCTSGAKSWVAETLLIIGGRNSKTPRVVYRASNDGPDAWVSPCWSPSTQMPRWASRLTVETVSTRVLRNYAGVWQWIGEIKVVV